MKKFMVEKHTMEITSKKMAQKVYEGVTFDMDMNRDMSADEIHVFDTEEEAKRFLNEKENDYWFNGSGYGVVTEWWIGEAQVSDEDGEEVVEYPQDYDICKNSNIDEFKSSLRDE